MNPIALALALSLGAMTAAAEPAGFRTLSIDMPHHGRAADAALFYPADRGTVTVWAENAIFEGVPLAEGAGMTGGRHPLVLLSHGMGGGIRPMAWLASGLAERGAIVLSVKHPNSSWGDFDMGEGVRHWTRAQDLSHALDVVLADPALAGRVDLSHVMAAGFSFGGWTALSLGGVRGNHAGFLAACRAHGAALSFCDRFLGDEIDLAAVDPDSWNASYADPRVTQVAAIDPGLVWGLESRDLAGLVPGVTLIGLGGPEDRLMATDFESSGFAALLPAADARRIEPAVHFTAMPLCKPEGPAILRADEDDPVCTDPAGSDRAAVHDEIITILAAKLGL